MSALSEEWKRREKERELSVRQTLSQYSQLEAQLTKLVQVVTLIHVAELYWNLHCMFHLLSLNAGGGETRAGAECTGVGDGAGARGHSARARTAR